MKKSIFIVLTAALLLSLCACNNETGSSSYSLAPASSSSVAPSQASDDTPDVDITEKMFVTYINEVYANYKDYVGKSIRLEGMFKKETVGPNSYYYVYRTGPGCCGNDGATCGFEFTWEGMDTLTTEDWISVTGKLRTYNEGDKIYLSLVAQDVTIKQERGKEVVTN